jgi:hypothetical protein
MLTVEKEKEKEYIPVLQNSYFKFNVVRSWQKMKRERRK